MREPTEKLPRWHRFRVWTNKNFLSRRFVPENYVMPIYHNEEYVGVRGPGPGFFKVSGWTERAGPLVYIAPYFDTLGFDQVPTSEGIQIAVRLYMGFEFDPRKTKREIAMQLVKLDPKILREVFKRVIRGALLKVVPKLDAWSLATGKAFSELETMIRQVTQQNLQFVGMKILNVEVQGIDIPDTLRHRLEQTVQRGINIDRSAQFHPEEIAQALFIEMIEQLKLQSVDYLNIAGLTGLPGGASAPPPPAINSTASSTNNSSSTPPPPKPPPSHLDNDAW